MMMLNLGQVFLYYSSATEQAALALERSYKGNSKSTKEIDQLEKQSQSNYREAAKLLEKAVAQGNEAAEYLLGMLYNSGDGVKIDRAKAKELFEQSCSKGLQAACKQLK